MPEPRREEAEPPKLIDVGASRARLPGAIAPMRARLALDAFNSPEWLFELKWDGIRAVALADEGAVRVVDRHGNDLLPLVPELRDLRLPDGTVLDGEIVVCDSRGRPSYQLLAARAGPKALRRGRGPYFVAFDLLYEDSRPLIGRPLSERRSRLEEGGYAGRRVLIPEYLETDGEPFLEAVAEYGLEGIVAKRRDGRYVPGAQSAEWLKCHVTPRSDVVLGAIVEDDRRGATAVLCGLANDDRSLKYVGDATVPAFLTAWLAEAARGYASGVSAFSGPMPLRSGLRWLRPGLVAMVEHDGGDPLTLAGARLLAMRLDARIEDCRPEEPVTVPSRPPTGRADRPRLVLIQSLSFD